MQRPRLVAAIVLSLVVVLLSACAGPRMVRRITHSGDTVKFAFVRFGAVSVRDGIIRCKADANGDLSDCQVLDVDYPDD